MMQQAALLRAERAKAWVRFLEIKLKFYFLSCSGPGTSSAWFSVDSGLQQA